MPDTHPPIPIGRLDHVGIAVPDLDAACQLFRTTFGCTVDGPIAVPAQGIRIAYVHVGNARLELMQPTGAEGAVARFLARQPQGGLHHIALTSDDVTAAAEDATAAGLTVLGGAPGPGHHGRPLFFLHPKDTGGILVEVEAEHD